MENGMVPHELLAKILFINKHKQEQISIAINKLNSSKAEIANQIKSNQGHIDGITTNLAEYKQTSYKKKLTNAQVRMIDIRKITYGMEQLRLKLAEAYKNHEQLNQEHQNIDNLILDERAKAKVLLIKEAKFEYIIDGQVA